MEVLISIFVMTFGLLGLVSLIPVGKFTVVETARADRSGACGRAALREVRVRRMLDPNTWSDVPGRNAFVIDPLGVADGLTTNFGGLPRISLINPATGNVFNYDIADAIFRCQDDLNFEIPDSQYRPYPAGTSDDITERVVESIGDYSWFLTVNSSPAEANRVPPLPWPERRMFTVSVVVCHDRITDPGVQRKVVQNTSVDRFLTGGYGGGSVILSSPVEIREDEWIMLSNSDQAKWYRVASAGASPTMHLTLVGPDWTSPNADVVVLKRVLGVYTTTIEVDRDLLR